MNTLKLKASDFPLSLVVEQEKTEEKFHVPAKPVVKDWNAIQIKGFFIMTGVMALSVFGFWLFC